MISERENDLRTLEFRRPEWVPIRFDILPAVWMRHGRALKDMLLEHPRIFAPEQVEAADPSQRDSLHREGCSYTDGWGCRWYNAHDGVMAQVVEHPLADWSALDSLQVPDPDQQENWQAHRARAERQRAAGELVCGAVSVAQSGFFFDRLQFLRGLENLLIDFMTDPPELSRLMEIVLDYNLRLADRWLAVGVDWMWFHGDIGMQSGLMISPETFRKHLKPVYAAIFQRFRQAGTHVHYSSDGNVLEIVDDLVECGVSSHDPQVGACGIERIARAYKGKLCAMVDLDEQILPFCTPEEIHEQVRRVVAEVGSPEGGLMIYACPSADVPLANIAAICTAWEKYCLPQ